LHRNFGDDTKIYTITIDYVLQLIKNYKVYILGELHPFRRKKFTVKHNAKKFKFRGYGNRVIIKCELSFSQK